MALSLLDLPTEVLIQIFADQDLPVQNLYSLAFLCRRLHFTALPVYLSRNGLDSRTRSLRITMQTDRHDLLAALRVALFVPSVDHLSFIFPHPSCTSILPFLSHMKRVEGFLSRLPAIISICLQLDIADSACLSVGSDASVRAWATHLGDLLNCVLEKQCSSLTLTYGSHFTRAYELPATSTPLPAVDGIQRASWFSRWIRRCETDTGPPILIHGPAEFRRVSQQGGESVSIPLPLHCSRSSRLTSLHIKSAILILPPGLSWTLEALRSCSISHLSFSQVVVERRIWQSVLPLLATAGAPKIQSLAFPYPACIPESEIMHFVAQLPNLTDLDISSVISPSNWASDQCLPMLTLQHLTRLRATPDFIRHLLIQPKSLPVLRTLVVVIHPASSLYTEIAHVERMLSIVVSALDADLRAETPAPVLGLAMRCSRYDSPNMWDEANDALSMGAHLDRVEHLEMVTSMEYAGPDFAVQQMVSRVHSFRRVHSVSITITDEANPELAPEIPTLAKRLACSIASTESLHALQVNGESYAL